MSQPSNNKRYAFDVISQKKGHDGRYDLVLEIDDTNDNAHPQIRVFLSPTEDEEPNNACGHGAMYMRPVLDQIRMILQGRNMISRIGSDIRHHDYIRDNHVATYKAVDGHALESALNSFVFTATELTIAKQEEKIEKEYSLDEIYSSPPVEITQPTPPTKTASNTQPAPVSLEDAISAVFASHPDYAEKYERLAKRINEIRAEVRAGTIEADRLISRISAATKAIFKGATDAQVQQLLEGLHLIKSTPRPAINTPLVTPVKRPPTIEQLVTRLTEYYFDVDKNKTPYPQADRDQLTAQAAAAIKEATDRAELVTKLQESAKTAFPNRSASRYENFADGCAKIFDRLRTPPSTGTGPSR